MNLPLRAGMLLLLAVVLAPQVEAVEAPINSPAELWAGYDPTALPLGIETLETFSADGCTFEKLRFTSESIDGVDVRVFAIRGLPAGEAKVPGILHIHGGGQTASLEWVKFWTKRGYACVTYDFCGPWQNRTEVTDWGPLKHGNMAQAAGGYQVDPTPRASSWYHWTIAARRALTLLAEPPRVQGQKLGIFGISMGGTLCWMVAGSDSRVATAVPIYGCGYNIDRRKIRFGWTELTPEQALFQRAASSEAHAPYVNCPVLFLNATNDFHGWLDDGYVTLGAVPAPHWQAFTPRYNHHIAGPQAADLPAWMDWQLRGGPAFPASPILRVGVSADGVPQAKVRASEGEVRSVDVYYALGDKPAPNRYWRRVSAAKHGDVWQVPVPVVDAWKPLFAYANVTFASGVCLTSNLEHLVPAQQGKVVATLNNNSTIDQPLAADAWYWVTANTDPSIERTYLKVAADSERGPIMELDPSTFPGQTGIYLGTHLIGDPQFVAPAGTTLALDVRGKVEGEGLAVTLKERDWTPLAKIYTAKIPADKFGTGWHTLTINLADFLTADNQKPVDWSAVDVLQLQGTVNANKQFAIGNVRWVPVAHK